MPSSSSSSPSSTEGATPERPVRKIPGDYGLPYFGPVRDRLDFFYFQGIDSFFQTRIDKYNSTIFRVNMPPGPFMARDPRVIVLLDAVSFPVLFDLSKVEKRNVLFGTFMPPISLYGGHRVLAFLDPTEPKHTKLKTLIFNLLHARYQHIVPEFRLSFGTLFEKLESELTHKSKSSFTALNDAATFDFISQAFFDVKPGDTKLGNEWLKILTKWLFFQVCPIRSFGFSKLLQEVFLHTYPLPSFLIKSDYQNLYEFFYEYGDSFLDDGDKIGISREEACHNLLFAAIFNAYGGIKVFFPILLKWIGTAGEELHQKLVEEIRSTVGSSEGVSLSIMDKLKLTKSVVYETLRIEPPIPYQYGIAKKDLIIESHDSAFQVKKGEMIFGYQPFATRDPKIFENADVFIGDRFVGKGEKLLKYVYWSNGRETEAPTVENKQCPGKDFVILISMLLVVEIFLRYDTFNVGVEKSTVGPAVIVKSVTKAPGV